MKIYGDKATPGYVPEKNEAQGKISKTPKSDADKGVQHAMAGDDLELTSKKVPVMNATRETNIGSSSSLEFDVGEVPMIKQKLMFINESIINNPIAALSAQANLNSETVARLLG